MRDFILRGQRVCKVYNRLKERARRWREQNPERKAANNRAWAATNPDKQAASARASKAKRRMSGAVRASESMSTRLRHALGRSKDGQSWELILGYSRAALASHLERQFNKGMSWANYGEWHIDHILPIASFDLDDPNEFRACWSLTNLRPIWATENIRKRDKRLHLV